MAFKVWLHMDIFSIGLLQMYTVVFIFIWLSEILASSQWASAPSRLID